MSIRIEIGERYVVTSDSFQFILHEKKRAESGKNAGQEWLAVVGYYPKLSQLVSGLMHHDILTGSAKSFADLKIVFTIPPAISDTGESRFEMSTNLFNAICSNLPGCST